MTVDFSDSSFFFSAAISFSAAFRAFGDLAGVAIFFPVFLGVPATEVGVLGGLPRPFFGVGVPADFLLAAFFGVLDALGGRPRGFGGALGSVLRWPAPPPFGGRGL